MIIHENRFSEGLSKIKPDPIRARKEQYRSSSSRPREPTLAHLIYRFFRFWSLLFLENQLEKSLEFQLTA